MAHMILMVLPQFERILTVDMVKVMGWTASALLLISFLFELVLLACSPEKKEKEEDKTKKVHMRKKRSRSDIIRKTLKKISSRINVYD